MSAGVGGRDQVGELVRLARIAAGMTQEELAERSRMSVRAVSALECGRTRRPYPRSIRSLAAALGLSSTDTAALVALGRNGRWARADLDSSPEPVEAGGTLAAESPATDSGGAVHHVPASIPRQTRARVLRQDLPRAPVTRAITAAPVAPETDRHEMAVHPIPPVAGLPGCQLPPALPDFTGRVTEVASLIGPLIPGQNSMGVPVAVISGPPGVGKSALALHVAHTVRHSFPGGQLHVQLAGSSSNPRSPTDLLGELLRALGVHGTGIPDSAGERAALFRSHTAEQKILLVADDASSADQVRLLLPGTAGSAVMVTSRSRLGGLAGARLLHLDPLPHPDAVEMLSRIVGYQRVAAEGSAGDRLVSACGRLPLAVRIAGARLATRPSWPVARVAEMVADERHRLDELALDDLAFRATVMPSYQVLDERARRAFRRLGLLGPADVAEWVVAALLGEPDASDVVNLLVDRSLLESAGTDATGEPRYRLHDLLRDYANERLAEEPEGERNAALVRALTGWLEIAAAADHGLPRIPSFPRSAHVADPVVVPAGLVHRLATDPVAWFSAERLNLALATRHACTMGRHALAAQLAAHQATFHFFQARLDEADHMWRSVMAATDSAGDVAGAARAELQLVPITAERGKNAEAMATLQRCVRVFEELGDQQALALALHWRAYCAEQQNLLGAAQHDARRGIGIAHRIEDRHTELSNLRVLELATTRLGDHDSGVRLCNRALALARELHEPYAEFETLQTLAYAHSLAAGYATAVSLCLQGIEMARNLGYAVGEAYVLGPLGDAFHGLGRHHDAIEAYSSARRIFQDRGLQRAHALCLLKIALSHHALGDYEQAAQHLKASLPEFRELRMPMYEERVLHALKECGSNHADS